MAHEETYPVDGHDFVQSSEIDSLASQNAELLNLHYHARLAEFRAQVFGQMIAHVTLDQPVSWALFRDDQENYNEYTQQFMEHDEVLMMTLRFPNTPVAVIRIIRSEPNLESDRFGVFSREVTVDGTGAAQYQLSALLKPGHQEGKNPPRQRLNALDNPRRRKAPHGTIFYVKDDALHVSNSMLFTESHPVWCDPGEEVGDPQAMYPFGVFNCREDQLFALGEAQRMVDAVQGLMPIAAGHKVLRAS